MSLNYTIITLLKSDAHADVDRYLVAPGAVPKGLIFITENCFPQLFTEFKHFIESTYQRDLVT